jgi:diguanylate cyclase (GGDEF)-like protein/PAS domain S-box-containing protein
MDHGPDFYRSLLDHLHDGVYFVNPDRMITYWNHAAEEISGFTATEMVGRHCADGILMHVDKQGTNLCRGGCPLHRVIEGAGASEEEVFLRHKHGHRVPIIVRATPVRDASGAVLGAVEIFFENTPAGAAQAQVRHLQRLALIDDLTSLPNRRYLDGALNSRLDEFNRYGWPFGVLFADVDLFKQINDRHGHAVCDRVLQMVSRTMAASVRPFDMLGRWGGEEFVGIAVNAGADELCVVAERLRALVAQSSFTEGTTVIQATVSVGATVARPEDTAAALIKRADQLLYLAKEQGRNRVMLG